MVRKANSRSQSLVIDRVENVSKDVFQEYYEQITELIGNSPGIYALYDGADLYYVGKSTDLRKRVKIHLKDRHLASWTHFSLYLVREAEHIHEIESLLVRIANPKGNRVIPKGRSNGLLAKDLRRLIEVKQKQVLQALFAPKRAAQKPIIDTPAGGQKSWKDWYRELLSFIGLIKARTTGPR